MSKAQQQNSVKHSLVLTCTAIIWGLAFVAQRFGMDFIGPFLFMAIRMLLGALTLLGTATLIFALNKQKSKNNPKLADAKAIICKTIGMKQMLIASVICGVVLFFGGAMQQAGLVFTTASKAGFLTTLYIVLVPILGIFIKHKTRWNAWVAVLIAAFGLYFLCIKTNLSIEAGDAFLLIGALFWAGHIMVVDHFVTGLSRLEVIWLCIGQFTVAAIISLAVFPIFDGAFVSVALSAGALYKALPAILYTGILSTGIAFTLQAIGQQGLSPTAAAIIMSLEAVFSLIFGMLILGEVMTLREIFGCILMFGAVILSQLPLGGSKTAADDKDLL